MTKNVFEYTLTLSGKFGRNRTDKATTLPMLDSDHELRNGRDAELATTFDDRSTFYDVTWVDAHFRSELEHVENLLGLACADDRFPEVIHARNQLMDIADRLTISVSAIRGDHFQSAFENLLSMWKKHHYRPTLSMRDPGQKALADIYDFVQKVRGVEVEAFRSETH